MSIEAYHSGKEDTIDNGIGAYDDKVIPRGETGVKI